MKINKYVAISMIITVGLLSAVLIGCGQQTSPQPEPTISGIVWNIATAEAGFSNHGRHTSLVFDNKMWLIAGWGIINSMFPGFIDDVWYSSDGINWTCATAEAAFDRRGYHSSVVFDNKMWVIGGVDNSSTQKNDVWYSSNGISWIQATAEAAFSAREQHSSVVFNNKIWVIGGEDAAGNKNDVWYSSNGINWTQATSSANFSARKSHLSVVFNNKIWVIGGKDNTGVKNDAWYSTDGITWTQATASAEFSGRENFAGLADNTKIWVIGGIDSSDQSSVGDSDVWYSTNGAQWNLATAEAAFGHRSDHTALSFNSKLWVIAGADDLSSPGATSFYDKDVWWSN
ncbi:MAG: hypothetical protein NT099_08970 [Candidatus Saganbacteria bacterium]|nr:hypothetical protein [Candidatus Saganbacteria bacterium]